MNGLRVLPGFQRTVHGPESAIWKRLPAVLTWGTALPLLAAAALWWWVPGAHTLSAADAGRLLPIYPLAVLVVLHWTLVLAVAVALGCGIVMLMKGQAYGRGYLPTTRARWAALNKHGPAQDASHRACHRGARPWLPVRRPTCP